MKNNIKIVSVPSLALQHDSCRVSQTLKRTLIGYLLPTGEKKPILTDDSTGVKISYIAEETPEKKC